MAGVSLLNFWYLSFFIVALSENYLFSFFRVFKYRSFVAAKTNRYTLSNNLQNYSSIKLTLLGIFFNFLTMRISNINFIGGSNNINISFLIFFLIFLIFNFIWTVNANNFNYEHLYLFLIFIVISLEYITNLMGLLLLVELLAALYYFFFLNNNSENTFSFIKYKNLLSIYLWLSFFTLFFLIIVLIHWVYLCGTINFEELRYFSLPELTIYGFLVGFFWKLGVPAFQFFKLELYRYLSIYDLIMFSILSLVFNFLIFMRVVDLLQIILINNNILFIFCILVNIGLLSVHADRLTLFNFLALSGVNTWAFFLIVLFS